MNNSMIGLHLTLSKSGLNCPKLNTFSERLQIQKKIYLIQILGFDLGYRFGWYLRGPYCRELTGDAFALKDELAAGRKDHEQFHLTDLAIQTIRKAEELWMAPEDLAITNDQWLELLASIHYLRHIAYWPKNNSKDFEDIFDLLVSEKPQFKNHKADAQKAWERLNRFGLIEAKTNSQMREGLG